MKDLCLYVHSFSVRVLGMAIDAFDGETRIYYMGDEKCLGRSQADVLRRELTALLEMSTGCAGSTDAAQQASG